MKIIPLSSGTGNPGTTLGSIELGQSAGKDKKINAARAFQGLDPIAETNEEQDLGMMARKRKLVMKTNQTPERYLETPQLESEQTQQAVETHTATTAPNEDPQVVEANKPLSPQFAELAKQKRQLQLARQAFESEKKAFEATRAGKSEQSDLLGRIKSEPLSVLQEAGVLDSPEFYDRLTERIMGQQGQAESLSKIRALEAKIESLEKGVDSKLSDRDVQAERQALLAIGREVDFLSAKDDAYEMIRATNSKEDVLEKIYSKFKETGQLMDTSEAMKEVEKDLIDQYTGLSAKVKKLQGQSQATTTQAPKPMTTLTNRDGASPATMSAKQRAVAAFNGTLKRG